MLQDSEITFKPIGIIHTPFKELAGMPIQPAGAHGKHGTVELFPAFSDGLKDIEGFSHIILLYHLNRSNDFKLQVAPFLEDEKHGVFAVRAPKRPNQIGMSIVKLVKREGSIIYIDNPDMLDGTPLLDIKPYIPDFDAYPDAVAGWCEKHRGKVENHKSDNRFNSK
ncbi:MAG: tRNA (N6-threonylcarbamoyladenosine(37)-N6)-methyltransferase TrmO [Victivallaceae bacterium]|nr:tRNA (N6-threonylcarbamoyladenosine(37)-N6)-methyltransferase TrmO [Victivallaceae bacterium]